MKILNFERLKILSLTEKEKKYHSKQKLCYINKFNSNIKLSSKVQKQHHYIRLSYMQSNIKKHK